MDAVVQQQGDRMQGDRDDERPDELERPVPEPDREREAVHDRRAAGRPGRADEGDLAEAGAHGRVSQRAQLVFESARRRGAGGGGAAGALVWPALDLAADRGAHRPELRCVVEPEDGAHAPTSTCESIPNASSQSARSSSAAGLIAPARWPRAMHARS